MTREYVFVTINVETDEIKSTVTTKTPAVSVDDAIKFLQAYKAAHPTPEVSL